ncbi:MAG: hypothetical protein ACR2NH_10550 [Solirubrobacteraceae bacterium]
MMRRRLTLLLTGVAFAAAMLAPGPASASRTQESQFQDDARLVFGSLPEVEGHLDTLRMLGVDRIRVSVFWKLVAPNPNGPTRPGFNSGDPAAYPRENWRRYDQLILAAYARGIQVNFNVTGPAPAWATQPAPIADLASVYFPDPNEFGLFVRAVGTRYSGVYTPPQPNPGGGGVLPSVNYWSLYNEPNQPFFLAPQNLGGREQSPRIYRGLADSAFAALNETGHGRDVILVGETAPRGRRIRQVNSTMSPMRFLRALYCVDENLRVLSGARARSYGCPATGGARSFARSHPVLFRATGFAHHPYTLLTPPSIKSSDADNIGIADLPRLTRTLDRVFARYGQRRRLPLFLTEYGYQSRPPDPFGFPQATAARFINQAEYMAFTNPRVRSVHQFLLFDDQPSPNHPRGTAGYWSTFQTGLLNYDGTPKRSYGAYRFPLWVPGATRNGPGLFRVWGTPRVGVNGGRQVIQVQFAPRRGTYSTVKTVVTRNQRGYVSVRVRIPRTGRVRMRWRNPATGQVIFSRVADVVVRSRRR